MSSAATRLLGRVMDIVPEGVRRRLDTFADTLEIFTEIQDPRVFASMGPSAVRGLVLQRGKQGAPSRMGAHHAAHFDWAYPSDHPAMRDLYERAKAGQWNGNDLPWHTDVDLERPDVGILPDDFLAFEALEEHGVPLDARGRRRLLNDMAAWTLSQFLHGEQGALYAAAQVTEAVQFFDGKLYGATQVVDEGRHVEVFHRYLDTKLEKLYQVNDNLFVILDALMTDGRWDMKFLGMQIMVEGLALGAFGTIHKLTREPLLKALLRNIIQDEARHVHYGVLALREHFTKNLTEREREEREAWAFETALLMRNRFLAFELYEESFAHRITRAQWKDFVYRSKGLTTFRDVMFRRMVPNLREIGLLSDRVRPRYEAVGLGRYIQGASADRLTAQMILDDLDPNDRPS
jgi:hypothetical protein